MAQFKILDQPCNCTKWGYLYSGHASRIIYLRVTVHKNNENTDYIHRKKKGKQNFKNIGKICPNCEGIYLDKKLIESLGLTKH
jgi:hypothetical protein